MEYALSRVELLLGRANLARLAQSRVAVIGLGGVGSHAAEALARCGVGALLLVDSDRVAISNLNRQLLATTQTVGQPKTQAMAERIALVAPQVKVEVREMFVLPENVSELLEPAPDYVIDAVDTVSAKLALAEECVRRNIPLISCMGAGNKLDPTRFRVGDLYETRVCPLCKVMRWELRKRGVSSLKVVWSDEEPRSVHPDACPTEAPRQGKRSVPGSVSFVPPVAGLIAAGEVLRDLIGEMREAK
ncbi:MAG TPA: tRNA threonylcarbamoyladenosine dehydratase [Clostridiales bacterium]|nr:tRNA threonylcarbamoyladenosine dehydratase [Clostridiales bacterium]